MPTAEEAASGQLTRSRPAGASTSSHEAGSGADLGLIDAYLQQLLPALAKASAGGGTHRGGADSLGQLGLSRDALLAAGLPQHTINALYRSMAAHAGAFRKMVAGEVKQLRSLLAQQAAPQLSSTIQILDGPIAAAAAAGAATGHATSKLSKAGSTGTDAASIFPALAAAAVAGDAGRASEPDVDGCSDTGMPARAFSDMADALSCLGPTANDLVKDYAEAYASMKENMEIRLRHEQRRGDFLQGKLQQTETSLKDSMSQLDAAQKRIMDQRTEHDTLAAQHSELQQALAVSHAAHLALQQHHQGQMEAWQTQRQETQQQHKQQLDELQKELAAASAAAAQLVETDRQAEALRLLYNEELARASKLAVELTKATAAVDKAAAQETVWAKRMAVSDDRADHAEGMATAMDVSVKQLQAQLALRQQELAARDEEAAKLRMMLERARLTAVADAAAARASTASLNKQVLESKAELKETAAVLTTTSDQLKLCKMALEGANAQLQAGRSHMKQLMADLEVEQEKCAGLAAALDVAKEHVSTATSAAEVAEARLKSTQDQLGKANDAAVAAEDKARELELALQEQTAARETVELQISIISNERDTLQAETQTLRARLSELADVQQEFAALQMHDAAVSERLSVVEEEHAVLTVQAEELVVVRFELQELRKEHVSLQVTLQEIQRRMSTTGDELAAAQASERASAAHAEQLQQQLDAAVMAKQQLARELLATSASGDSVQQEVAHLTQQMDDLQAALEAAEMDRQALAAQRDGWMASFQEAYGKLQEWTVSSEAASHKLAQRAGALQEAMQSISLQAQATAAAEDDRAAAGGGGSRPESQSGQTAAAAAAAAAEPDGSPEAAELPAAADAVMDQLAGLQQLVRAEAHKQQEVFDSTLKALHDRVQERHQAAQSSWQKSMTAANQRRAARAAAKAEQRTKKRTSLMAMAAANSHAARLANAAMSGAGPLPLDPGPASSPAAAADATDTATTDASGGAGLDSMGSTSVCGAAAEGEASFSLLPAEEVSFAVAMGHAGTAAAAGGEPPAAAAAAAAAAPVGGDLGHSTETVVALSPELAQQQVQPAWLRQPDSHQQQQQLAQQVSQPASMQQAPQHLQKDAQYQQLQHQATQYQQLLVQYQALQQQYASLAGQLQQQQVQQQQQQVLQHSMSQDQQRQQEHEHKLLQQQLHAGDQALPSQQQALEQLEYPEGQAQAEPLLAGTVECCEPTDAAASKVAAGEEQGLAALASASGTGSTGVAAEPVAGPQQPPLVSAPEGVTDENVGTHEGSDGGSSISPSAAASTSASRPVSAAAAGSSNVDSASSAAASNAGADGTAPLRSMQRVTNSHRVTQTTIVTVVTTSSTSTALSTEHSSNSSDDGGGAARVGGSSATITASSSQQHLTFSSVQQHSEAGVSSEVAVGFMGSSAGQQSADAQAPAQVQADAPGCSDSAGSLAAGQLLSVADFPGAGLSPIMLSISPASGANSAGFLPSVLPGLPVPSASAAAATAAGFAAPDFSSPAAPFGSSRMGGGQHTPAELLQVNSRSFGSSDSFGSSSNSPGAGGTSLAGFVSIATYQEQMQSMAKLHGEVGQLAVQLREAHADAEGAQQLLQQERKEGTVRTTALREALGQLHGQLEELREDHKQLQESHRALMTKDLMSSGLLRDRYVADLFERLQEALWKLDLARQRAATWGFDMLVPLGRSNRGIQTQAGEIWAATGGCTAAATATAAVAAAGGAISAVRMTHSAAASAAYCAASCSSRLLAIAGGELSAEVDPEGPAGSVTALPAGSRGVTQRKAPAFTQHSNRWRPESPAGPSSSSHKAPSQKAAAAGERGSSSAGASPAAAPSTETVIPSEAKLLSAVVQLLMAGGVHLLPVSDLLRVIASLYSSKAAADARALRSHSPPQSLWSFVLRQLLGPNPEQQPKAASTSSNSSSGGSSCVSSSCVSSDEVVTALAQLLASAQAHGGSSKEVAAFEATLVHSIPYSVAAAAGLTAADGSSSRLVSSAGGRSAGGSAAATGGGGTGPEGGSGCSTPGDGSGRVSTFRGTWGELRLDDSKLLPAVTPGILLPDGIPGLVQQVLDWPGMSALLGWVSGGHFLGGLGPHDLGKALLDVQAPHIHFLLLEAADILQLHPLPRVQVVQAPAPFVRLLRIPIAPPANKPAPGIGSSNKAAPAGGGSGSSSSCAPAVLKCQRASLLVMSSAAMQLLQPAELQAAMAGALAPLALEGFQGDDEEPGPCSSSSSGVSLQPWAGVVADLATLASLLALSPAFLLGHLPPEMHAMGSFLAAALLAVERLVGVVGDRAGLLVCQDVGAALGAVVKTAGASGATGLDSQPQLGGSVTGEQSGGLVQQWQQRSQEAQGSLSIQQLLPQHSKLAALAAAGGSASRAGGGVMPQEPSAAATAGGEDGGQQLSEEQVLLLRVRELLSWSECPMYRGLMAGARPLRRVVRPGSANSSRSIRSA